MATTTLDNYNSARRLGYLGLARNIYGRISAARNRYSDPYNLGTSGFNNRMSSARAARSAWRSRSRTMTRTRKSGITGIGVTEQHDSRLIYEKRPMPSREKKKWKAFRGKVLAVSEKDLGTQQVVLNKTLVAIQNVDGYNALASFGLYTLASNQTHYNDLAHISTYLTPADNTVAKGLAVDPSTQLIFKSGILDVTIRNSSTLFNGTANIASSEARMEVDVYELTMRHSAEETGGTYNTLEEVFNQNKVQCAALGGTGTEIDYGLRGVTPFDLSYALSRFGITITRKTKYQISNNDQVTYQMRDPRRHVVNFREINNQDGFNKPGLTRLVYIVGKLAPGLTLGTTVGTYQAVMSVGLTRKYTFKIENYSEDRTRYEVY